MRLPQLPYQMEAKKAQAVTFGGLNRTDAARDGDAADSRNISLRRYPVLATRRGRKQLEGYCACTALTSWNKLIAVDGTRLLYDGKEVGQVSEGEKQFAVLNTKLVIWPDRVYYDLQDNKLVSLGASLTAAAGTASFTADSLVITDSLLRGSGRWGGSYRQPGGGTDWLSSIQVRRLIKFSWSAAEGWGGEWEEISILQLKKGDKVLLDESESLLTSLAGWDKANSKGIYGVVSEIHTVLSLPGYGESYWQGDVDTYQYVDNGSFADRFKAGDTVAITGAGENSREGVTIKAVEEQKLTFEADTFTPATNTTLPVSVSRGIPSMDYICESDNRLWGCSTESQTIYASALGDPTNFYTVSGLSTDSYTVPVGSEGAFTGCCKLGSSILFWKERRLHKVLGSYPAEYMVYSYDMEGVKAGCHKSMQVVDEVLYYLGVRGVYAYSGGAPGLISACFGEKGGKSLDSAAAGSDGGRYYLSGQDREGNWNLLVYDIGLGLWVREDGLRCRDFARVGSELYFADGDGEVFQADSGEDDPNLSWMVQFTPFYETVEGRKRYSKLLLRTQLPPGSWVAADCRYDEGAWQECGKAVGRSNSVIPMRLGVSRCDKFELRLRGKGPCAVLSILREFRVGSDL